MVERGVCIFLLSCVGGRGWRSVTNEEVVVVDGGGAGCVESVWGKDLGGGKGKYVVE